MIPKIFVSILLLIFLMTIISAGSDYCVTAEVSDISPSSIGINKEFTIGIQIENCGGKTPEYISFELINPPTDIEIKEPLIINISNLYYGNSKRFITYHMKTTTDAKPGTHVIKTKLSYGNLKFSIIKNYNITFNVIGSKAELSIASVKTTPVLPYEEETVELTLRIENFGDGTANAVKVYVDHPFQGIKESFIGTLNADEDGPAILTFILDEVGEFEFPVTISYKDDFGDNEIKTNINFNVLKKKSNIGAIILAILIITIFGAGIYYFIKTKKSKNKIIHQLLGDGETALKSVPSNEGKDVKNNKIKIENHSEKKEREKKERRRKEFKRELLKKYKK